MYLDALLLVSGTQSAGQAFGAGAVSTNSIDLGLVSPTRKIGTGHPMGFAFQVSVAATVAATVVEIISATDAALTAGIVSHVSRSIPLASAVAGALFFIPLPQGTPTLQFMGIRTTTAGGTISARAWLTSHNLFSLAPEHYSDAITVS